MSNNCFKCFVLLFILLQKRSLANVYEKPRINPEGVQAAFTEDEYGIEMIVYWEPVIEDNNQAPGFYYLLEFAPAGGQEWDQVRVQGRDSHKYKARIHPKDSMYKVRVQAANDLGFTDSPPQVILVNVTTLKGYMKYLVPKPTNIKQPDTLYIRLNKQLRLKCPYEKVDLYFAITWYRDDDVLTTRDVIVTGDPRVTLNGTELLVSNVEPKDGGTYRCEMFLQPITNLLYRVEVGDIETIENLNVVCDKFSLTAKLEWSHTTELRYLPSFYTIYVDAVDLQDKIELPPDTNTRTHTINLVPNTDYIFRVSLTNPYGESKSGYRSCTTPPQRPWKNPNPVTVIRKRKSLLILWKDLETYQHNGADFKYKIQWRSDRRKSGTEYAVSSPLELHDIDPTASYIITVISTNREGESRAMATRVYNLPARVQDESVPSFYSAVSKPDQVEAELGGKATLQCDARDSSSVTWKLLPQRETLVLMGKVLKSEAVSLDNGDLVIENVQQSDYGVYECIVVEENKTETKIIELI